MSTTNDPIAAATAPAAASASASASARTSSRGYGVKRGRPAVEINTALSGTSRQSSPSSATGTDLKKRKTVPGSRGVANLTPEQLAKKRANDREAQRAIRERTKLTIENLERRIGELTSQQPYQELQVALRAKEAVEAENADIKRRLATIMAMIQPMVTPSSSSSSSGQSALPSPNHTFIPLPAATTAGPQSNAAHHMSTPSSADHDSPPTTAEANTQWNASAASAANGPPALQSRAYRERLDQQRRELAHGLEMGSERLGLGFILDQSKEPKRPNGRACESAGHHHQLRAPHGTPVHSSSPYALSDRMDPALSGHVDCARPIKNCPATCQLDHLLLDFLAERRQRQAEGFSTLDITGPRYPSVSSLLNPLRDTHPLSRVFIDILRTLPDISQLPEKVGTLYVMFLLMRWQIDPSPDNYDRLPPFLRPLPSQLCTPHPAWVDHLVFPALRERLVAACDRVPFAAVFPPFAAALRVGWPYADADVLLPRSAAAAADGGDGGDGGDGDELMLNPVFERHLRRLENWTLNAAFARALPMLDGTYNLRAADDGRRPVAAAAAAAGGAGAGAGATAANDAREA